MEAIISPKQNQSNVIEQSGWYNYYAGYSDAFVKKYIEKYSQKYMNPTVLDPWNGAGTTTLVCNYLNITGIGIDINPIMNIIAKSKLYNVELVNRENITILFTEKQINDSAAIVIIDEEDYLHTWFTSKTVHLIRTIEYLIRKEILDIEANKPLKDKSIDKIDIKTAFYYMVLFNTIKAFCTPLKCSNPTWVKRKNIKEKIEINVSSFVDEYLLTILNCKKYYTKMECDKKITIKLGDSKTIDASDNCADIIISSPPYCTRIDYIVATVVELAIMGYTKNEIDNFRANMIGTPTIDKNEDYNMSFEGISASCNKILSEIKSHNSKAARSYYYKTYYQYFYSMWLSLKNIDKLLKNNGTIILITQDSYFKNICVNISKCIKEMLESIGYTSIESKSFAVVNNMRYINSKSRKYKNKIKTYERTIVMRKGDLQ